MAEFISERSMGRAVEALVGDADDVRIAVAFWGDGGTALLGGLSKPGREKPRVICNLESGACNPDELHRLRKVVRLRTHPQLHAKVYWTPRGVILGSSNASTNGLWGEGKESRGWREANLLVRDHTVIDEIGAWFDEQWLEGLAATSLRIEGARSLWLSGKDRAPTGRSLSRSLFTAYRDNPRHPAWKRVKVAFSTEGPTDEGKKEYDAERAGNSALQEAYFYEGWKGKFGKGDWVVDVDAISKSISVSILRIGDPPVESDNLTFLSLEKKIDLSPFGMLGLDQLEKEQLKALLPKVMKSGAAIEDGGTLLSLQEAVTLIDRHA